MQLSTYARATVRPTPGGTRTRDRLRSDAAKRKDLRSAPRVRRAPGASRGTQADEAQLRPQAQRRHRVHTGVVKPSRSRESNPIGGSHATSDV